MKKIFLLPLFFSCSMLLYAETEETKLQAAVNTIEAMFRDLKTISDTRPANQSKISEIRLHFSDNYFSVSDQDAPNEFKVMGYTDPSYTTDISVRNYVNQFYNIFRDEKYSGSTFLFERKEQCIIREPEFRKGKEPAELAQIIVRKVYNDKKGRPFAAFDDTLVIGLKQMLVYKWANVTSRHHIGEIGGGTVLSYEIMRADAAIAYNKKQFDKAYKMYQEMLRLYPKEIEPYYRMAVMLYNKEYGKELHKKQRNDLILYYLEKSQKLEAADNMRYWITC